MSVTSLGARSLLLTQSLVDMRAQLNDLQRQLATGKRSDTYAGIGTGRGLTVGLRSHLAAIESYGNTITSVSVRLDLAQTVLSRMSEIGREVKTVTNQAASEDARTTAQVTAMSALGEMLGLLNTKAGDRSLFAGLAGDQPAVGTLSEIMDGDGIRAGFRQVAAERLQADLGADGLGRLVISAPTTTSIAVSEDVAGSVFGFKLASVSSTLTGATTSAPAGSPAEMSIDLTANPNPGETVRFSFTLPDGSTETITLTATDSAHPGADEFAIGADAEETAANLKARLTDAIGTLARTSLSAASALAAADNFFNMDEANPPLRVDGPPFETATGLVSGTASNTVFWYKGEAGSQPARSTASAQIDQAISVNYGLRANEEGIRWQLQHIAALAAISLPETDADSEGRSLALAERLRPALEVPAGMQSVQSIQNDIATAQASIEAAKDRHTQTNASVSDLLQEVEGITDEEVAAKILAMQTTLQASLQTTASLFRISILNYL